MNEYAAMIRPRSSSGTRCWISAFACALLTIIAKPMARSSGYAVVLARTNAKITRRMANENEAAASTTRRRTRSPTVASVSAPANPPMPTQARSIP